MILPGIERQIDDLDDLAPPEDLQDDVDEMLDSARDAFDEVEGDVEAALNSEDDPFAETNEKAEALGLSDCAG